MHAAQLDSEYARPQTIVHNSSVYPFNIIDVFEELEIIYIYIRRRKILNHLEV
jgi:hypothetical protein